VSISAFARLADGTSVSEVRLANRAGAEASVLTFGAALRDLVVPLPDGARRRVVLGFDGLDGYPGRLDVSLTYRLEEPATFAVSIRATTDAPTIVSLAHHSYWTLLPGASSRDHRLAIAAGRYVPFGSDMKAKGTIETVAGTPYDFRALRQVGDPRFGDFDYDCYLVLDGGPPPAARLEAPDGSLALEVETTEPGIVLYDGAGVAADLPDVDGSLHFRNAGLCLEPMRFPDNPNQPAFPSARLDPGGTYSQETRFRFLAG